VLPRADDEPLGHILHDVLFANEAYEPTAHGVQIDAAAKLNVPGEHRVQLPLAVLEYIL
jgi:hypothetical protein